MRAGEDLIVLKKKEIERTEEPTQEQKDAIISLAKEVALHRGAISRHKDREAQLEKDFEKTSDGRRQDP